MFYKILISALFLFNFQTAFAQNTNAPTAAQTVSITETLAQMPPSEAVMYVDAQRFFNTAIPLAAAGNQSQLTEINRQIERFKEATGIDAREFDVMAVALDFSPRITSLFPPQGTLKIDPVVVARGRFDSNRVLESARRASEAALKNQPSVAVKERESRYKNKIIYRIRVASDVKIFGLFAVGSREISVAALDNATIAVGNYDAVRDAIDASAGGKRVDPKLARLAVGNPNAVMGFAGEVPKYVSSRVKFSTPELSRPFRELRGFYGFLEAGQNNFILLTNLQTTGAAAAADLSRTINLIKEFVPGLIEQLPAVLGKAAGLAIARAENTTINPRGDKVEIRVELKTTN